MKDKIEECISQGKDLLNRFKNLESSSGLEPFEHDYKIWDDYNTEFLSFLFEDRYLSKRYDEVTAYFGNPRIHPDSKEAVYNRLKHYLPLKVKELESILNRFELLELKKEVKTQSSGVMKKIFISHASKDKDIVEKIIDLLEVIGVDSTKIFCTSFEGYGIKLGENFLNRIKEELDDDVLVLFVLSDNFYKSPVCLCEMGATWVKTSKHIPILIPPFSYDQIKGVLPNTQGLIINEIPKINSLKEEVESTFQLQAIPANVWERKRTKILSEINEYIEEPVLEKKVTFVDKVEGVILEEFKKMNSRTNHILQFKWINLNLLPQLNPKEQDELNDTLNKIFDRGFISYDERSGMKCLVLTEKGFDLLY